MFMVINFSTTLRSLLHQDAKLFFFGLLWEVPKKKFRAASSRSLPDYLTQVRDSNSHALLVYWWLHSTTALLKTSRSIIAGDTGISDVFLQQKLLTFYPRSTFVQVIWSQQLFKLVASGSRQRISANQPQQQRYQCLKFWWMIIMILTRRWMIFDDDRRWWLNYRHRRMPKPNNKDFLQSLSQLSWKSSCPLWLSLPKIQTHPHRPSSDT